MDQARRGKGTYSMCELGERIKLCTCGDVDTTVGEYWELYLEKNGARIHVVGSFEPSFSLPAEPKLKIRIKDMICKDLNSENCFDFPYEPRPGDELKIVSLGAEFWFSYYGLGWMTIRTEMSAMPVGPSQTGHIR